MDGAFHFGKSIVASLTLACLALAGRYVHSYLFRDVEQPDFIVVNQDLFRPRTSQSPQRSEASGSAVWKIAVVTNRTGVGADEDRPASEAPIGSLLDQVREMSLSNPRSTHGFCNVDVPLLRNRGVCEFGAEAPDAIRVDDLSLQPRDSFLSTLRTGAVSGSSRNVLVFIHGFNVGLNQAIGRAAQMAEDIPFHGTIIVFSWQSLGRTDAYRTDEQMAERYFWNLAELLYDVKSNLPDSRLHVLTHSMGNRVTLRAINALCGAIDPMGRRHLFAFGSPASDTTRSDVPRFQSVVTATRAEIKERYPEWGTWRNQPGFQPVIENLIMAAPDVAADEFQDLVGGLKHACRSLVLYASDSDYALEGSRLVNGQGYRAGDSRAGLNIEGLTTIRVTGVDGTDRLGHSFYGSRPAVLDQLQFLLNASGKSVLSLPQVGATTKLRGKTGF